MVRLPFAPMVAAALVAVLPLAAAAEDSEDNTRAVRILPDGGPAEATVPATPPAPPPANYAALNTAIKADNPAGLSLDMLPGTDVAIGTKIVFRIATRKPGYLVLVDVDSTGKLTQIYPNPRSTMRGAPEKSNFIKPGAPISLPDPSSPYAGYEFVAEGPAGTAMVVALLSEQPVQIVDLPDVAATAVGQADAFKQVYEAAKSLKIVNGNDTAPPRSVSWSVDAKYYAIR